MKDFVEFFGLNEDPFRITPDIDYFYMSSVHQEALGSLEYLLASEEGFAVIIGEPGTGKTITIRKFIHQLGDDVEYAYILFPNLSPEELLKAVLEDFGIDIPLESSKNKVFSMLRDFLIQKKTEGKKVVIIVDEAQNLPVETLEELRILSNMETDKEKLLQIILLGQPELEEKLESSQLRQLRQRITIITHLRNLSFEETVKYINYRFAKAGNPAVNISEGVYKLVYSYTEGNLRKVNLLMERALMSAYIENIQSIETRHIKAAAESLKLNKKRSGSKAVLAVLSLILLLSVSGLGYYIYSKQDDEVHTSIKQEEKKTVTVQNDQKGTKYMKVRAYMLNMREKPSRNSDVIYLLKEGDKVEVIEERGEWVKVKKGEVTGWVKTKYLSML
ncbi:AAA family ATPase [Persephonella sp.]